MTGPNGHLDLDARRKARAAAEAESALERYGFTFGGQEFTLAPAGHWPANAKALAGNGDFPELIDAVVDNPEKFWAVTPTPTIDDIKDLIDAWGEWAGVGGPGESPASPRPASIPT